jgi:putative drug exporter of the RND superfamily
LFPGRQAVGGHEQGRHIAGVGRLEGNGDVALRAGQPLAVAAIMVVVFLSFVLIPDVSVKQIGLGLAAAVLIDATVVRLVLVPAVMELLGKANWWLPGRLDRRLPAGRAGSPGPDEPPAGTPVAARAVAR